MNKSEILIIQNIIKTVKSKATGWEKILALTEKGFVCGRYVCVCMSYLCYLTHHWEANNCENLHEIDKSLKNITY